jgi:phosphoglycolate phosphatase
MHKLNSFYYIKEVIQSLKNKGYAIGILTTNSGSNVKTFLEANDMANLFQFIVHGSSIYGKSNLLQSIIKKSDFTKYYYVGDEVRDIEATRNKENTYSVAVTWGYNSKTLLQSHDTDYIVDAPLDLMNIIE